MPAVNPTQCEAMVMVVFAIADDTGIASPARRAPLN
jgi:fumarate hydratase class II